MAQYQKHIRGDFDDFVAYVESGVAKGSVSASREGGYRFEKDGVRCVTRVFERYSYMGGNRLSLSVTVFGKDNDLDVCAITSGGSQAVFFKINTLGEEAFLRKFADLIENYQ